MVSLCWLDEAGKLKAIISSWFFELPGLKELKGEVVNAYYADGVEVLKCRKNREGGQGKDQTVTPAAHLFSR